MSVSSHNEIIATCVKFHIRISYCLSCKKPSLAKDKCDIKISLTLLLSLKICSRKKSSFKKKCKIILRKEIERECKRNTKCFQKYRANNRVTQLTCTVNYTFHISKQIHVIAKIMRISTMKVSRSWLDVYANANFRTPRLFAARDAEEKSCFWSARV